MSSGFWRRLGRRGRRGSLFHRDGGVGRWLAAGVGGGPRGWMWILRVSWLSFFGGGLSSSGGVGTFDGKNSRAYFGRVLLVESVSKSESKSPRERFKEREEEEEEAWLLGHGRNMHRTFKGYSASSTCNQPVSSNYQILPTPLWRECMFTYMGIF